jgi:hypothetical protein
MKVSIAALIYKSTVYADFVYDQIHKYTPLIKSGDAEFFFVANDASEEVLNHLLKNKYPFVRHDNQKLDEYTLFKLGIGKPEYLNRVYKAWNRCILESKGNYVCLINSDMAFSPNWLENLMKHANESTVVSSLLIERGHEVIGHFPESLNGTGSILFNCGKTPNTYNELKFLNYIEDHKKENIGKTSIGGVYMPIIFNRSQAIRVGLYPEGNIAGSSFNDVVDYGDRVFIKKLKNIGVEHITTWESVAYHFQQGEMESS